MRMRVKIAHDQQMEEKHKQQTEATRTSRRMESIMEILETPPADSSGEGADIFMRDIEHNYDPCRRRYDHSFYAIYMQSLVFSVPKIQNC